MAARKAKVCRMDLDTWIESLILAAVVEEKQPALPIDDRQQELIR